MISQNNTQQIWESFSNKLKRFIKSKVNNKSDAEDILQEVFLKIHKNINTLDDKNKLPAWIYSITRNSITDFYRKKGGVKKVPYLDNINYIDESIPDEIRNIKDCLKSFINNLPEKYRSALELSDIQGLRQKEVADLLEISLPGVKSRIQRGRAMIKEHFIDCCKFKIDNNGKLIGGQWPNENCEACETCAV